MVFLKVNFLLTFSRHNEVMISSQQKTMSVEPLCHLQLTNSRKSASDTQFLKVFLVPRLQIHSDVVRWKLTWI